MADPMEKLRDHLSAAGLLDGYTVRFYAWTDEDLNGAGQVICFRRAGSGGGDMWLDSPDVSLQMICGAGQVKAGETRMDAIRDYIFGTTGGAGSILFYPVGSITGPTPLMNGRMRFEMVTRVLITRV